MCLQNTVTYSPRWNWDGDRIVPETIVPSGRPVVPEVTIPANLKNRPCFRFRGALPHHNEIAVDEFPREDDQGRLQDSEALRPSYLRPTIHLSLQHRPKPHPERLLRELVPLTVH